MKPTKLRLVAVAIMSAAALVACSSSATPDATQPEADVETEQEVSSAEPSSDDQPAEQPTEEIAEESPPAEETEASADLSVDSGDLDIVSDGQSYASYLAAPSEGGPYPAVVLIHSFNGMEEGYRAMTDRFAARGFVVLAVGWQTFERSPADAVVQQLARDGIDYLSGRDDVDPARIGLTGFCAGGRYTMLLLPQIDSLAAGVAWYGFPYNGSPAPADFIDQLDAPMLIIHGANDGPSPIGDIYRYTEALDAAGKTYELEVYDGEPHGFMLANGQLREDEVGIDAFERMIEFFSRTLG